MTTGLRQMPSLRLTPHAPRRLSPVRRPATPPPVPAAPPAIDAIDPRWVVAMRAAMWLDGGRAAVLVPERRRGIVRMARKLGLREFDAGLIIAIIQDAARTGEDPLGCAVEERLGLIRTATPAASPRVQLLAAGALGLGMFIGLVALFGGF
jgi:hypothetical protein